MIKVCAYCGKEFEVNELDHNDVRRKYCGYDCSEAMKNERIKAYKRAGKKANFEKVCVICGLKFTTNKDRQLVCGERCAKERKRIKAYEYNKSNNKPIPKIKPKPKNTKTNAELILEKNSKAKEMGMSYGQYDAWLRIQADREEREKRGRKTDVHTENN